MGKEYPRNLYDKQFSLYVPNILARLALQEAAYSKEKDIPPRLFEVYKEQRHGLLEIREKWGSIVTPDQIAGAAV